MPKGKHNNHVRGEDHYRWRGGNPKPDPEKRRSNAKNSSKRYPERRRAREKVKDAVQRGDLRWIKSCQCVDCGKPANSYAHPRGFDDPLDVEPVCFKCHGLRNKNLGVHKRKKIEEFEGDTDE